MTSSGRRVALLSLSPEVGQNEGLNRFPNYGIRRIQAAVVADPLLSDAEMMVIDDQHRPADYFISRVRDFRPDVLGMSVYVWSLPIMMEVARQIKREFPACTVVLGGSSARPEMLDLPPFAAQQCWIDALVVSDGEETFCDIMALEVRDREALSRIPGLAIPTPVGWLRTPKRVPNPDMDTLASPFQLGLMPHHEVAYVETFRGCPLTCAFCQWGVMDSNRRFSEEYLIRELQAIKAAKPIYTFLVDAALNLNINAFRNLIAAEKEVGYFRETPLLCEVYPNLLRDEHMEFIASARHVQVGLGVQSLDNTTLTTNSRSFKPERLRTVIDQLNRNCLVDVEIILGLPGDTPEAFRRTLNEVLELPCNVRVYRCLILPDALMTRAPKEFDIRFDPVTLMMTSCHTWSERQLRETQDYVTSLAGLVGRRGFMGEYWWHFVHDAPRYVNAYNRTAESSAPTGELAGARA
jgi:radical SAM superfamily enzyme YgiQ (UPF0313 family)